MPVMWIADPATQFWAGACPLPLRSVATRPQYPGRNVTTADLVASVGLAGAFPAACVNPVRPDCVVCGPSEIIGCFAAGLDQHAIALIAAWGGMLRPAALARILAPGIPAMAAAMVAARGNLVAADAAGGAADAAWNVLTGPLPGGLAWTRTMASKTLHFLARSVGIAAPPLPIDNACVLQYVWPTFITAVNLAIAAGAGGPYPVPGRWDAGHGWQPYNRYMTAVDVWAAMHAWVPSDFESTMFYDYV